MAVRAALVVEAGDRLLADVAALGEADGVARRCPPRPASSRCPSRRRSAGAPASMRRISAASGSTSTAPAASSAVAQAARLRRRRRSGRCPSARADGEALDPGDGRVASQACSGSAAVPATSTAARADQREDRPLLADVGRPRPRGRSSRSRGGGGRPPAASGSVSSQISLGGSGRSTRMSACMWPLRSSSAAYWPSPGASASTSLVSCPCRYSAASGPLTSSLPRSERSSRPHSSRSCRYWASSSTWSAGPSRPILRARRSVRRRRDLDDSKTVF